MNTYIINVINFVGKMEPDSTRIEQMVKRTGETSICSICTVCQEETNISKDSNTKEGTSLTVKNSVALLICEACLNPVHLHCFTGINNIQLDT